MARTKVNANDLKLRRLEQNNDRLLHDLRRRRMTVSIASIDLINFCNNNRDPLISALWGPVLKTEDPYLPPGKGMCCMIQ